jgi:hypothetical protein
MAKKLVIFLGAAVAAAVVASAVTRNRRSRTPLLETATDRSMLADGWRSDDTLSTELADVVADEVAAAR